MSMIGGRGVVLYVQRAPHGCRVVERWDDTRTDQKHLTAASRRGGAARASCTLHIMNIEDEPGTGCVGNQ